MSSLTAQVYGFYESSPIHVKQPQEKLLLEQRTCEKELVDDLGQKIFSKLPDSYRVDHTGGIEFLYNDGQRNMRIYYYGGNVAIGVNDVELFKENPFISAKETILRLYDLPTIKYWNAWVDEGRDNLGNIVNRKLEARANVYSFDLLGKIFNNKYQFMLPSLTYDAPKFFSCLENVVKNGVHISSAKIKVNEKHIEVTPPNNCSNANLVIRAFRGKLYYKKQLIEKISFPLAEISKNDSPTIKLESLFNTSFQASIIGCGEESKVAVIGQSSEPKIKYKVVIRE